MSTKHMLNWLVPFFVAVFLFFVAFVCIGMAAFPWLMGYHLK